MNTARIGWLLATLVFFGGRFAPGAEPASTDAAQFLKQSGLEAVHATYAKYFTLLSENKSEDALQVLVQSLPPNMNAATLDQLHKINDMLQSMFVRETKNVELVGILAISEDCVGLYYIANGKGGPALVVLVPYRWEGRWRTHTWSVSSEMTQVIQHVKGITRFSKSLVVPLKPRGKTA